MNPLIQSKNATILPVLIALTLGYFGLLPQARAVCQEGCDLPDHNTFLGDEALVNDTGFGFNTALGDHALFSNTIGEQNTAVGLDALFANTSGFGNVAVGNFSLSLNTIGSRNTAIHGMEWNTTGNNNTAVGFTALNFNDTGSYNTASGDEALFWNTTGSYNTAAGYFALYGDASIRASTGTYNTATGAFALQNISTGSFNTATGVNALLSNTNGNLNTATGLAALRANTGGSNNTADGYQALGANTTGINNTACGISALLNNSTGSSNIALGSNAGVNLTDGSNNIDIGSAGLAGESNSIRIGTQGTQTATYIAGIYQATVAKGVSLVIDASGHLGTKGSAVRLKDEIKPMDKASEAIHALQPVTFRYKPEIDPEGVPQFGLVAEQVEKVNPDLVARDAEGQPYTVRYEAVNAMLLNEFLKEHRRVEEQGAEIAELKAALAKQAAQIQKVSEQLRTQGRVPLVVANN